MTGPNEAKLRQTHTGDPGALDTAHDAWAKGAEGLRDVARSLGTAKSELLAAWEGRPSEAASTSFDVLAKTVTERAGQMEDAAEALRIAKAALEKARTTELPAVPSIPSTPEPDADGEISVDAEKAYSREVAARNTALDARESVAGTALQELDAELREARRLFSGAAPYDPTTREDDATAGGTTGGTRGTTTGGQVNSGSASGSSAVIGGTVGGTSATADGELIGTVGSGATGVGLLTGGTSGGSNASGGSQIGGTAGGVATAAGGIGAALGGLRNVLGGKTVVAGGTPAPGSAVGGNTARAGSPVLGGLNGQAGAGARTAGAPGTSATGRGPGVTGGAANSTTAGRSSGAGAGGRGGARGVAGAAGAAGQRDKNDDQSLDHIRFEDDWIEDEDIAPGVIE